MFKAKSRCINEVAFGGDEQSKVPVNADQNYCHQIPHYDTLDNVVSCIQYILPTMLCMEIKKMLNKQIDIQNIQLDKFTRCIKTYSQIITNLVTICKHKLHTKIAYHRSLSLGQDSRGEWKITHLI